MKRKILTVLAAVVILASAAAVPAAAGIHRPIRGDLEIELNVGLFDGSGAAPAVSWYGTVEVKGETYPIVYYAGPLEPHGDYVYFEDRWEVLASLDLEVVGGVITKFVPGDVIIESVEKGWGGSTWAYGLGRIVTANPDADPHGVFERAKEGNRTLWVGRYTDDTGLRFAGSFRVFAGR